MRDFRTRVLLVRFSSDPDPDRPRKRERIRFAAASLYPPEVKRQLVTVDTAEGRAMKLARQIIERQAYRPPDLDALQCTVEVTLFDLRPLHEPRWVFEDGTKVWLSRSSSGHPIIRPGQSAKRPHGRLNGGQAPGVVNNRLRRAKRGAHSRRLPSLELRPS